MSKEEKKKTSLPSLVGKTVAVTGATGGLGSEFCRRVAELGADIIMLDRNTDKSLALKNSIVEQFPEARIDNVRLDLGSAVNVDIAVAQLGDRKIDYLVLNAGVFRVPRTVGQSGYNNIFEVNFISPYRLARSLMPNIADADGKIIAVGSIAHRSAKLDETDIDYSRKTSAIKVYGNSKRFLMFSLYELIKRNGGVGLAVVHPGITPTPMTTNYCRAIDWIVRGGMRILFPSPRKAVDNLVQALYTDCDYHEWIGPKRCDIWGKPQKKKLCSCSAQESARIFKLAEAIYNGGNKMGDNEITPIGE